MPIIHHVCSHLQNAFRARLKQTCFPYSQLNYNLLCLLRDQGFINAVMLGTPIGPHLPVQSIAQKRLWVDLKYVGASLDMPILNLIKTVSKPSRRVFASYEELAQVAAGRKCLRLQQLGLSQPLVPGQVVAVNTPNGVLSLIDAVNQSMGGEVLCTAK